MIDFIMFIVGLIILVFLFKHNDAEFQKQVDKPQDYMG